MFLEEKERQVTLIVSVFLGGGGRRGVEGGRGGGYSFQEWPWSYGHGPGEGVLSIMRDRSFFFLSLDR